MMEIWVQHAAAARIFLAESNADIKVCMDFYFGPSTSVLRKNYLDLVFNNSLKFVQDRNLLVLPV
jgi:hypothetical protein